MAVSTARRTSRLAAALVAAALTVGAGLVAVQPAEAVGTSTISGRVTGVDAPGGLQDVYIGLTRDGIYAGVIGTNATGNYSATGLEAGTYTLFFTTTYVTTGSYIPEYWSDKFFYSEATPIVLGAGVSLVRDAVLAIGGTISGTVTGEVASTYFDVSAFAFDPGYSEYLQVGSAVSVDGSYTLGGLPPGNYRVRFTDPFGNNGAEYYNDVASGSASELVTVVGTADTPNINAQLTVSGPRDIRRIAGNDRFQTSAAVAQEYASATTVYIANGLNYPDALSAAPAAASAGGPLLLTLKDTLPSVIATEITRLNPARIVVVGGAAVVSNAVFSALEALQPGTQVERISGADRYATSIAISRDAFGSGAPGVFVATGSNFPDALSAAAIAGSADSPVLLVVSPANSADAATLDVIDDLGANVAYIAGGTAVVSSGIEQSLNNALGPENVTRYGGPDRYLTSFYLNDAFVLAAPTVYLAVGTGFADALSGAALAGKNNAPLFVIPSNCIPPAVRDLIEDWNSDIVLLGGPTALNAQVESLTTCPYAPS